MSLLQFKFTARKQSYTASIEANSVIFFESFARFQQQFNKAAYKGEALIDALVQHSQQGDIRAVTISFRGEEHDAPSGRAAVTTYKNDRITSEAHKIFGKLHGFNAEVSYYPNGQIREAVSYLNGLETDLNNDAARRWYTDTGIIQRRDWAKNGEMHDGPNGYQTELFDEKGRFSQGLSMADHAENRRRQTEAFRNSPVVQQLQSTFSRKKAEDAEKKKLETALKKTYGKDFKLY